MLRTRVRETGNENILCKTKFLLKTEIYYLLNTEKYCKVHVLQMGQSIQEWTK